MSTTTSSTTQSLSCEITTTKQTNCVDPILYILEEMAKADNLPFSQNTYKSALDRLLDKGIVEDNCDFCCPDCGNIYTVSSVETFLKLAESLGWVQSAAVPA